MKKAVRNVSISLDAVPCFAGQLLRGSLNFALADDTFFKSIVLSFEGCSKTAKGSDGTKPKIEWYYQVRVPCMTYIEQASSATSGESKRKLDKGDHVIPFVFPLPPHAPTSFGGKHGFVYHCVKATITVAAMFGSSDFNVEQPIPLIGMEDLNWHPASAMPVSARHTYTKRRMCITKAVAHMVLRLSKNGFVIGEPLDFNLEVSHSAGRHALKKVTVRLMQSVYYQCGDGSERVTHSAVAQVERGPVLPNTIMSMEDETIQLTGLPPSFLRGCDNITIHYDLVVLVDDRVCMRTPVILGTMTHARHALAIEWVGTAAAGDERTHTQCNGNGNGVPPPPPPHPHPRVHAAHRQPRIPANFASGWRVPVPPRGPHPVMMAMRTGRMPWRGAHPPPPPAAFVHAHMCRQQLQHKYRDHNDNVMPPHDYDDKPVLKIEEIED